MKPIRRARYFVFARSLIFVSGTPSMNTSPSLRSSRPLRQFRSVVLPHPEGPITATISPLRMSRSMPRSAWTETAPELYTLWAFTARTMTSSSAMCVQIREGGVYLAFWRVLSHAARLGKQVYHGPSEKYRTGPDRAGRCGGLLRADGVQVEVPVHFEAGTPAEPAQRLRQLRGRPPGPPASSPRPPPRTRPTRGGSPGTTPAARRPPGVAWGLRSRGRSPPPG